MPRPLSNPSNRSPSTQIETEKSGLAGLRCLAHTNIRNGKTDSHASSNHPAYLPLSSTAECHRPNPTEPIDHIDPETPPRPQSLPQEQFASAKSASAPAVL